VPARLLRFSRRSLLAASLALAVAAPARAEGLRVVVSIKPIHSLVAGVMEGVARPELLVPGSASPHVYTLRPSDARRLDAASVVIWIGPVYEGFLVKPLRALAGRARIVTLAGSAGVELLPGRSGGVWGEGEAAHHHSEAHDADQFDGHLWLDPANAKAIVATVLAALSAADPGNAARFAENARRLDERLDALDQDLRSRLAPVATVPFLVFHDAYQYLERRYGLSAIGAVQVHPESAPGARRVGELAARIASSGARCVFSEPQFAPALVSALVNDTGVRSGVLDPLGAAEPEGPDLYFALMRRLADALRSCLGG
jgi:zinc transport system substrate-binding protein